MEKLDLKKGILHQNLFRELCKNQEIDDKLVKTYLLNFDLAVKLNKGKLFIPSVVSDTHKVTFLVLIFSLINFSRVMILKALRHSNPTKRFL